MLAVVAAACTSLVWESTAAQSGESDISCPAVDGMPQEPGCQVRCTDDCSAAQRAVTALRKTTVPSAHMTYNRCPPFTNSWVTIKSGADETASMPGKTLCKRICAVQLSSVAVNRRMAHHRVLCEGAHGSVVVSDGHLHTTNVVVDIRRSTCSGPSRTFRTGFLRLPCSIESKMDSSDARQSAILNSAVAHSSMLHTPARTEAGLVIFVTRTDMGNMAHNLGTVVGVFDIVHALRRPPRITFVMLDIRLMCWGVRGQCQPDCFGPFRDFWLAIGDMAAESRVLGLQDWAAGADVSDVGGESIPPCPPPSSTLGTKHVPSQSPKPTLPPLPL